METLPLFPPFVKTINVCRTASAGGVSPEAKFGFDREAMSNAKPAGAAVTQTFALTGAEYYNAAFKENIE
jgi:hypothetical protein